MALSQRAAQVLGDILRSTTPVRLFEIATRTGVSERTAKSDVNLARTWLEEHGFALSSAGTRGLWVNCSDDERAALLRDVRPSTVNISQSERRAAICLSVLTSEHPIAIGRLAEELGVARNTVLHDLADLETELDAFGIRLERTRLGLTAVAARSQRILALDHVLRGNLRYDDLAWLTAFVASPGSFDVDDLSLPLREVFVQVSDPAAVAAFVGQVMDEFSTEFAMPSDIAIGGMVLRLALVLIVPGGTPDDGEGTSELGALTRRAAQRFTVASGVELGAADLDFVFQEAALVAAAHELDENRSSAIDLAHSLIERVDAVLQSDLSEDPRLLQGLTGHLSDRFAKLRNSIIEPNVIVHEVQGQYSDIYRAVEVASRDLLTLSQADLSFIAVHFAAAYERYLNRPRVRTLVVCATGRGVASLIGLLVQSRFPSVEIVRTTSMFEARSGVADDIDLVISTFPVDVGRPTAVIRSVPTQRDFDAVQDKLETVLAGAGSQMRDPSPAPELGTTYQGLVTLGVALNRELAQALGGVTGTAAEGLLLHCLLLAERLVAERQYDTAVAERREGPQRSRVLAVFQARQLRPTEAELQAILAYLDLQEES